MPAWIFQGNPSRFDVDDYVMRYPELIYWRTPRYGSQISLGDRAFVWRAGRRSGMIAIGKVVEIPVPASHVKHPEALGDDLWRAEPPAGDEPKTGIHLHEVRISDAEPFVPRGAVMADPLFSSATIITMPNGTVFPVTSEQSAALERLWGAVTFDEEPEDVLPAATEGGLQLRSHYRRERSQMLRLRKIEQARRGDGLLECELCGFDGRKLPVGSRDSAFEVHHRSPLSFASSPVRTTLEDLALLCANCHRAVHSSPNVDRNWELLKSSQRGGF
jgi:5-methylcytosine-specific restriction endonuclease McrA